MNPKTVFNTAAEIEAIVGKFENCTLPRADWNHGAHLTVALWYLTRFSEKEATDIIRDRIKKYNAANGIITTKTSGYHETMTLFWIKIVGKYLSATPANSSIVELANGLVATWGKSSLPLEYYGRDRLMSWQARTNWVEPDLKPIG